MLLHFLSFFKAIHLLRDSDDDIWISFDFGDEWWLLPSNLLVILKFLSQFIFKQLFSLKQNINSLNREKGLIKLKQTFSFF